MLGRGVDQILPHPSDPALREWYVRSALEYVALAKRVNGPIPKPVDFRYVWGDALTELDRLSPRARIINLETSVTTSGRFDPKGINYRMHPANTPCLTAAKIDCCVLANSHILDWGRTGLIDTVRALRNAGIMTAGAGQDVGQAWAPTVIEVSNQCRVVIFAAGTNDSGVEIEWAASRSTPGVAFLNDLSDRTVALVSERVAQVKRAGDIVVLSIHWGGNWGYEIHRSHREFAHKLVDLAHVALVYGHSSHHPKGFEIYHGKLILYGCGDFLNDYEGIAGYEEYRSHLVLGYFPMMDPETGNLQRLEMAPFEIKRFQLHRATAQDARWLRDVMVREGTGFDAPIELDNSSHLVLELADQRAV